jgi:SnoaL-like domain
MAAFVREYAAAFENWQIRPEEIVDAGDHVFAAVRDGGRIKGAKTEIFNRFFHVFTFRDSKVVRFSSYLDRDEALEAAGLREWPDSNVSPIWGGFKGREPPETVGRRSAERLPGGPPVLITPPVIFTHTFGLLWRTRSLASPHL